MQEYCRTKRIVVCLLFLWFTSCSEPSNLDGQNGTANIADSTNPIFPERITFCSERVPLHKQDIRERFDRELTIGTYWKSKTSLILKRANRWFPIIESILKKENVPVDFKYLVVIESGLTNAISPRGAAGFWQFMPETANEFNLEVSPCIDQRFNVRLSTIAACKYLKKAYLRLGSWTLAAAAYNIGTYGMEKRLKNQLVESYYDMHLNSETARYVFRILAAKSILNDSKTYGFNINRKHLYPPYKTKKITVDSTITDLSTFANSKETDLKTIKLLNPWLRCNEFPVADSTSYVLLLPR